MAAIVESTHHPMLQNLRPKPIAERILPELVASVHAPSIQICAKTHPFSQIFPHFQPRPRGIRLHGKLRR